MAAAEAFSDWKNLESREAKVNFLTAVAKAVGNSLQVEVRKVCRQRHEVASGALTSGGSRQCVEGSQNEQDRLRILHVRHQFLLV